MPAYYQAQLQSFTRDDPAAIVGTLSATLIQNQNQGSKNTIGPKSQINGPACKKGITFAEARPP